MLGAAVAFLGTAQAAVTYSIDFQSPTKGTPDINGQPITEADLLMPTSGLPGSVTKIVIDGGQPNGLGLLLYPGAVGLPGGVPGGVEVDALSFGNDTLLDPGPGGAFPVTWVFSVDEFALGLQPPVPLPPNVSTEGPLTYPVPPPPGHEASADMFAYFPPGALPPGIYPLPPFAGPPGDTDILDGDGTGPVMGFPFSLGLVEPNFPSPGPVDAGDNIDALDVDDPPGFPVYFSLDTGFPDPIEGMPNSGSAFANGGFPSGMVLVCVGPGAAPIVYATPNQLGLDLFGPPDSDDLDALILWDNGDGLFQPPTGPYSWTGPNPTDMIFFSVRRGSAVIGMPDAFFGVPITEGDILMPSAAGGPPGIWVSAETLGLCTWRPGGPQLCPFPAWGPFSDDVDGLDLSPDCDDDGIPDSVAILTGFSPDCNGNGVPDACDIANGTSQDCQPNGIPDECDIDPNDPDGDGNVSGDCNGNGVPDECDLASGCLHDADGDGVPDECECPSDLNGDGVVNIVDLLQLLGDWGPCP